MLLVISSRSILFAAAAIALRRLLKVNITAINLSPGLTFLSRCSNRGFLRRPWRTTGFAVQRAWPIRLTRSCLFALFTDEVECARVYLTFVRSDCVLFNENFFTCHCFVYYGLMVGSCSAPICILAFLIRFFSLFAQLSLQICRAISPLGYANFESEYQAGTNSILHT
ncbi:hypothetical protein NIES2109_55470 (plasmid) [Nostoc sp. HK-01]|nr:hypothetical protein NIES2109_55470 [Nostoc sp. HK-01]